MRGLRGLWPQPCWSGWLGLRSRTSVARPPKATPHTPTCRCRKRPAPRKILAQQFDPAKLAVSGDPVPVTKQVYYEPPFRYADLSVFGDRMLLYRSGGNPNSQFIWFDRGGRQLAAVGPAGEYRSMQLSPDGGQVLLDRNDPQVETSDIWQFDEIYVQSFPEPGRKMPVSKGDGMLPRWRRDGKELYYVATDDKLMAVPVQTGASFSASTPVPLFDVGSFGRRLNRYVYDVSADGQKFLLIRPQEDASTRPLTVVQNWTALLKK